MPETSPLSDLTIRLDPDGKRIFAIFSPKGPPTAITTGHFTRAINAAGFEGHDFVMSAVSDCVAKYSLGEAYEIEIGSAKDGEFKLLFDDGDTTAYLTCIAPKGGVPISMVRVLDEAKRQGVVVKLDLAAVKDAVLNYREKVIIARGKVPVEGVDGRFVSLLPSLKPRTPMIDEKGLTDFRELGEIVTVRGGDALMRCIPATPGEPGIDVFGRLIPAKPGKSYNFPSKREGSAIDPKDPNLLLAAIQGCPVLQKDVVTVEPLYIVNDVDLSSGNIHFDGSVHVKGDVHAGMTIKVLGNIRVDGMVERACLTAGGDIDIKGGILGQTERDEKFQAKITCNGSCTAHFAQNAIIHAGNGIFLHEMSMQSELVARHQIIIGGKRSGKGQISGGSARAAILVKARVIGAPSSSKTVITVGADKELYQQLDELKSAREVAENLRAGLMKVLNVAAANPGKFKPEVIKTAMAQHDHLNGEISAIIEKDRGIRQELSLSDGAQIIAEQQFLEGVEVRCGAQVHRIKENRIGGAFQLRGSDFSFV